ncbi:TPA: hypothetical protein DCX16_03315, partial [bacterium]|nr:hypothetical protein [bacterium]
MGESISTKMDLIRLFLKYPINAIPVVDEKKAIVGFISKQDIIASSQTTEDMNIPVEKIVDTHLNLFSSDNLQVLNLLIKNYNRIKKLPVIDKLGNIVGMWEKY